MHSGPEPKNNVTDRKGSGPEYDSKEGPSQERLTHHVILHRIRFAFSNL